MKKSEKLFMLINEIDEQIINEAKPEAEKPVSVRPEKRASIKGIIALAACIAVLAAGIFALVRFKTGGVEPAPFDNSSSSDIPQISSSSDISGSDSESLSSSGAVPEFSEDERIEELIRLNVSSNNRYPNVACEVPEGMYVSFEPDKEIHIPVPSDGHGPGITRAHDISYLEGQDFLVVAYDSGKPNLISFLRTDDKGVSWQSSELEAEYPWGFYNLAFLNSRDGIFLLKDRDVDSNQSRGDHIIYTTDNYGKTWKQAGTLSGDYSIIAKIKVAEDHYWITGEKDIDGGTIPVLLKSDDGVNWKETQMPFDTTKSKDGYCTHVYFSGKIGVAQVVEYHESVDNVFMLYASEDGGETWSFYKATKENMF